MNKELNKAIKDRNEFLKKNPGMQSYQNEIDNLLDRCPNLVCRLQTILSMMNAKTNQLCDIISSLKDCLKGGSAKN